MKAKTKQTPETYIQCCWCSETFSNGEEYINHYFSKLAEGDNKHTHWVRLFKEVGVLNE